MGAHDLWNDRERKGKRPKTDLNQGRTQRAPFVEREMKFMWHSSSFLHRLVCNVVLFWDCWSREPLSAYCPTGLWFVTVSHKPDFLEEHRVEGTVQQAFVGSLRKCENRVGGEWFPTVCPSQNTWIYHLLCFEGLEGGKGEDISIFPGLSFWEPWWERCHTSP